MEYRQKLADLGIDVSRIRREQGATTCPKCSHERKKKKDPCLSVNIAKGAYSCHHCGWEGNVRFDSSKKKEYVRPTFINQTECNDGVVQWFQNRGISQMTLVRNKVMSGISWMPQTGKEEMVIMFNYIRNGELINIKYRDSQKNFKLAKDAELIFYGLDDLKDSDEYILIAEGECCKLAWNQAGINFALSVPNGASKSSTATLEYLDNCLEYFDNNKKIILATDNDEAGMILREELSRRLGKGRCYKVNFKDVKDANDYLIKYGEDKLRQLISKENLIEYPIKGVIELDDIWGDVNNILKNGLKRGVTTGIYPEFDKLFSFSGSKLCMVTGAPNSGKSPFIDQIMLALSIRHEWKWAIVSMESKPIEEYIAVLVEKITGKAGKDPNLSDEEIQRVKNFMQDHFFFIEANPYNNESDTIDFVLESVEDLVRRKGIKGVVIDPWNKIEHKLHKGENETNYVSRVLDQIIRDCQKYDLFTFLVAHPTKLEKDKDGQYKIPTLYDISGSSNFYNKPDWGIAVHRNYITKLTEIHVIKAKWRHLGELGKLSLTFNPVNGRFGSMGQKFDFSNWLDSVPCIVEKTEEEINYTVPANQELMNHNGGVPEEAPF